MRIARAARFNAPWGWSAAALLIGLTINSACTSILGIDNEYVESASSSSAGGMGGSAGAAVSSGGVGGVGVGGGFGGGGFGGGGGGANSCPQGPPGPSMVAVGGFCIDATEVSNDHYQAFVAADPPNTVNGCNGDNIVPSMGWPPAPADGALPVVYVDWCSAARFCKWAGKQLCGDINGGRTPNNQFDSLDHSRWFIACTQNGQSSYPYGGYQAGKCVDDAFDGAAGFTMASDFRRPVGSADACHGGSEPYASIFDLSGNVREWEDACQGNKCQLRGGSFKSAAAAASCATDNTANPSTESDDIGFRCCSDRN